MTTQSEREEDLDVLHAAFDVLAGYCRRESEGTLTAVLRRVKAVRGVATSEDELREWLDGFDDFDEDTRKLMYFHNAHHRLCKSAAELVKTVVAIEYGEAVSAAMEDEASDDEDENDEDDEDDYEDEASDDVQGETR